MRSSIGGWVDNRFMKVAAAPRSGFTMKAKALADALSGDR